MENLIPEITLHNQITSLLEEVQKDYEEYGDESALVSFFEGLKIDNFDFANEAIDIFTARGGTNQMLQVFLGFNLNRTDSSPAIHILLPSEQTGNLDALGVQTPNSVGWGVMQENAVYADGRSEFSRSFSCEYNLMITSPSPNQTVLVYHFLRAMLIATQQNLEAIGLINITFSGQDVTLMEEFMPPHIFSRALRIHFDYAVNAKSFQVERFFKKICLNMKSVVS
jgi:hypothetical protein